MVVPESQTKGFRGTLARTAMSMAKMLLAIPGMKTAIVGMAKMHGMRLDTKQLMAGINEVDRQLQERKQREIEEKQSSSHRS